MSETRWFQHKLRVRYQETDQMGVVYHANYLNWFEIGRTELIRELGYPYRDIEAKGLLLPVLEAALKFSKPARYDDLVTIYTKVVHFTHIRIEFASEIRRDVTDDRAASQSGEQLAQQNQMVSQLEPNGELLVSGGTKHVWVNPSWKPVRIDKEAPKLFELLTRG